MAVNLSPVGGVAAQFFNNDGTVLSGGLIYTYAAGTNTNQATYTTSAGTITHSNPIVLNSAGRVPTGEIWLTDGLSYKFVLKDSSDALIATYDNISGINSNFVNFTNEQEIQTATANQTVFTLTTMQYQPATGSLSVFVDGVNQYGPSASYAYTETSSTVVTFVSGLHVGASVKFTTSAINASSYGTAFDISYTPPFTASVATNVGDKLAQTVSVKDFGAVGDGATDDTAAIQAAINYVESIYYGAISFPVGTYKITDTLRIKKTQTWFGNGGVIGGADSDYTTDAGLPNVVTGGVIIWQSQINKDGLLVKQDPVNTYRIVLGMENITWIGQITSAGVGPGGTTGNGIVVDPQSVGMNVECHFYNVNISYFRERGLVLYDGYYGSTFNVMAVNGNGKTGISAVGTSQGEFSFSNIRCFGNGLLGSGETEQAGMVVDSGGAGITLQRISCTSNARVGLYLKGVQHQLIDYHSESFGLANNANQRNLIIEGCQPSVLRANFSPTSPFLGVCVELRTATNGLLMGLNFYSAVAATGYQVYEDATSGTNVIVGSSAVGTVYKQIQPYTLFGFGADAYGYGTQTNNNAIAGNVGEFITATVVAGSAVSLVTATAKTVTSISLTRGDWDVSAVGDFTLTGATTSYFRTGVNVTTNVMPNQTGGSGIGTDPMVRLPLVLTTATTDYGQGLPPVRISLAATTTIYLVCEATFAAGSVSAFGTIRARRMR